MSHHFYVFSSNRTEVLFQQLATLIESDNAPFQRFTFLVQGRGMERWLQQRLSEKFGVWMGSEFPFPQAFFDQIAALVDTRLTSEYLQRDRIRWQIESLLRTPDFAEEPLLKPMLSGDGADKRRFQLAEQLANLFDQYQIFRPDWLDAWSQGQNPIDHPHAEWQMQLWQTLDLPSHRGQLWQKLIDALNKAEPNSLSGLPSQVFAFGVSFMPPLMLATLQALSRHLPVHLFTLSPTEDFWADLPSKKMQKSILEQEGALSELEMTYHPLLLAMGRQGAHFQHLLLETEITQSYEHYTHSNTQTLLTQLQQDIAKNTSPGTLETPLQNNILFHRCHTPQREVEVLRDRIIALLAEDDTLAPNDIVVMAADLNSYRPFIETLFAEIPHTIADRSVVTDAPALKLLQDWFSLIQGRLDWDEVFGFLYQPEVQNRLHLSAQHLETLYDALIEQGQVRWGLAGDDHRNHWRDGLQRVMLGAIMQAPDTLWEQHAPVTALEGQAIQQLTPLLNLFEQIEHWQTLGRAEQPIEAWLEAIQRFTDFFYDEHTDRLPLDEALKSLADETQAIETMTLSLDTLSSWAQSLGAEQRSSSGFLSQGITFCDLLPMRAIPIKVGFLLGMNDRSYPRPRTTPDFDLLLQHFRIGDRDPRAEDRYTFLELLLSVRDRLEILWQGLSADKNTPQPPAQVVLELMDILEQHYQIPPDTLTLTHKAYPFHSAYFEAPSHERLALQGRWPQDYATCDALHQPSPELNPLWEQPLNWEAEILPLETLSAALADPVHWALQQAELQLSAVNTPPEAREKLSVNGLDSWHLRDSLSPTDPFNQLDSTLARKQAEGAWPLFGNGNQEAQNAAEAVQRIQTLLANHTDPQAGKPLEQETLTLKIAGQTLSFTARHRHENGQVIFYPHRLKGKQRLALWLSHLFLNALAGETDLWVGHQEKKQRGKGIYPVVWHLKPLDQTDAQTQLQAWIEHFKRTCTQPPLWHADWMAKWIADDQPDSAEKGWFQAATLATGLRTPGYGETGSDASLSLYLQHLNETEIRTQLQDAYDLLTPLLTFWQSHQESLTK